MERDLADAGTHLQDLIVYLWLLVCTSDDRMLHTVRKKTCRWYVSTWKDLRTMMMLMWASDRAGTMRRRARVAVGWVQTSP